VEAIEVVDRGIDTPREAQALVQRWESEGFEDLSGYFMDNGTAVLWDPDGCTYTESDYANGVALSNVRVRRGYGDFDRAIDIRYFRICGEDTADLTVEPSYPVSSGTYPDPYKILEGYRATLARVSREQG